MLDKTSEKILRVIIKKCGNDLMREIDISHHDFIFPKMSNSFLNIVCQFLFDNDYISTLAYSNSDFDSLKIVLKYKGYAYFQYKRISRINFVKNFLLSKICDIIVSAIVAYVTVLITG